MERLSPEIRSLSYVVLGVRDLGRWEEFAVGMLGMQVGPWHEDALALRMDEHVQRIILERSDEDDLLVAGWDLGTEIALAEFTEHLKTLGVTVTDGGKALAKARAAEQVFCVEDPMGYRHELCFGSAIASTPFRSPILAGQGFVTGTLGMGHIVIMARDYATSVGFYRDVLRLRISDYIREPLVTGQVADITFFHTMTGRHHSIATTEYPSKKRLNHFMIEVASLEDVGRAFDRIQKTGHPVSMSIGQHSNDRMVSFYVVTPSGFSCEYGYGGVVIDGRTWTVASHPRRSLWGHQRSRQSGTLPPGTAD